MKEKNKILIIDDDPFSNQILKQYLEELYLVETAASGNEGFNKLTSFSPDLIILDIMLPDINGYQVCKKIREKYQDELIKILLISGRTTIEDRVTGYKAGANDFIVKPLDGDELLAKVRVYLKLIYYEKELKELNTNLENQVIAQTHKLLLHSITDDLTGLPNSVKLSQDINGIEWDYLILLNIDSFNIINNAFGYIVGDSIIKQVANDLNLFVSSMTIPYRIGADEFVILLTKKHVKNVTTFSKSINKNFNKSPIWFENINIPISFSIGYAEKEEDNALTKAHFALNTAKKMGPGNIVKYGPNLKDIEKINKGNIIWAKKVKDAIAQDRIQPFFQPILDNRTNKITRYEALARLIENGKIVTPNMFLGPAKKIGLLPDITEIMIRKSIGYFKTKEANISINITQDDLLGGSLIKLIKNTLNKVKFDPQKITFEVLENVSVDENKKAIFIISEIKDLGCKIAIDDFGSENSNFARLLDVHADYIKIDGSFIKNIHKDKKSFAITKALVEFGHSIGAELVAEFVHCKEILEIVKQLGIDYSQGFFISKPQPEI
jgi:diguanylate cyclase (GGDEF)-like protein